MVTPGEREHAEMALDNASAELYDHAEEISEAADVSLSQVHELAEEIDMMKQAVQQQPEEPENMDL